MFDRKRKDIISIIRLVDVIEEKVLKIVSDGISREEMTTQVHNLLFTVRDTLLKELENG